MHSHTKPAGSGNKHNTLPLLTSLPPAALHQPHHSSTSHLDQVTLPDAGHLQFLDTSDGLAQSMCAAGRGVANAQVAAAAAAATVAFARGVVAATAATTPIGVGVDVGAGGGAGGGGKGWESGGGRGGLGAVELRGLCERALEGATALRFSVEAAVP